MYSLHRDVREVAHFTGMASFYRQFVPNFSEVVETLKTNSQIAYRTHAVPLPHRAAKGLNCVFPI